MEKDTLQLIVDAAFAVRKAHQSMRSNAYSRTDIEAVRWHENKLWDLYQEQEHKEAGQ